MSSLFESALKYLYEQQNIHVCSATYPYKYEYASAYSSLIVEFISTIITEYEKIIKEYEYPMKSTLYYFKQFNGNSYEYLQGEFDPFFKHYFNEIDSLPKEVLTMIHDYCIIFTRTIYKYTSKTIGLYWQKLIIPVYYNYKKLGKKMPVFVLDPSDYTCFSIFKHDFYILLENRVNISSYIKDLEASITYLNTQDDFPLTFIPVFKD